MREVLPDLVWLTWHPLIGRYIQQAEMSQTTGKCQRTIKSVYKTQAAGDNGRKNKECTVTELSRADMKQVLYELIVLSVPTE